MALVTGDLAMKRETITSKKTKEMSVGRMADPATGVGLQDVLQQLLTHESDFRVFVRRRLGDDAMAEDVLQESLMRAVERQHTLQKRENVVGWFYRILRNAIVDVYRSRATESKKLVHSCRTLSQQAKIKLRPSTNYVLPSAPVCSGCSPTSVPPMQNCSGASTCKANPLQPWHKNSKSRRTTSLCASIAPAWHSAPAWRNLVVSAPSMGVSTAPAISGMPDFIEKQFSQAL